MATAEATKSKRERGGLLESLPRSNLYNADPDNLVIQGLDTVADENTVEGILSHKERNDLPVPVELIESVYTHGVLKPVEVCRQEDALVVVEGRDRVRACREANKRLRKEEKELHRVPIIFRKGDQRYLYELSLIGNLRFKEDSPLTIAAMTERLITVLGATEQEAASAYQVTVQTIKARRALLTLPTKIQRAVDAGKIAATSAARLAAIGDSEKQLAAFDELLAKGGPISRGDVDTKVGKTKGTKGADEKPPRSRRVLNKLLKGQDAGKIALNTDVYNTLRWVLGKVSSRAIEGLGPALRVLKLEE